MHPRTKNPLQPVVEQGIFIKILPEGWPGFFGVDEAHLHSLADKSGQSSQKGFLILAAFHVQILDVGRAYPQRLLDAEGAQEDVGVVGVVGDEGEYEVKILYECPQLEDNNLRC